MKVKFSRCNSNSLANVPQVDGQLIYVKDTSEVYMDVGNNRNKLSDVIEVADITNVQNPIISKIYYDEATENLYKYIDNEWKSLGGSFTPQVYFWDGNQQTGLTFWNNIMKVNEDNDVVVLYTFSDFSLSAIIKIPQRTLKTKKVTNWYDYYDLASNSSNVIYSAMKARVKFTIENDVITTYTIETTTVASMSVLETNKDYATPYVPLYDGSPANKKYVDDKCIPYQPFPSGLDTSHTTQAFITSIRALNLPAGSTYLGGVTLTDMPFNGNAEVEIYVYPNNVVYCVLRSANVAPYEWECNSHTFRGWEAVGKAYTDTALSAALASFTPQSTSTTFDNTGTGLQATNVQDAIEELLGKLNDLETTVGQVDEILDEIIGDNTDITDVVYTTTDFTLDPETGYYEVSGAGNWELSISFTKHSVGTVSLNYKGTKLAGMESYSYIYLDNVEDSIGSSSEYTNFDFENVTAGTHTIRIVVSSGDDRTNMSVKLLTQTN